MERDTTRTIQQRVEFPGATPSQLFALYVDPRKHAAATGAPVEMDPVAGGRFAAYGGLTGRNLLIEPPVRVVQAWRANVWKDEESDSVLILTFAASGAGARVNLVHTGVPDRLVELIEKGWRQHYWDKWRQHLAEAT